MTHCGVYSYTSMNATQNIQNERSRAANALALILIKDGLCSA